MKTDVAHTNVKHLQENSKSAPNIVKDFTWKKRSQNENRNLCRETESVYFYLINVNLLSPKSERNAELLKLHTGIIHVFIKYKTKINSLPFLRSSA